MILTLLFSLALAQAGDPNLVGDPNMRVSNTLSEGGFTPPTCKGHCPETSLNDETTARPERVKSKEASGRD